MPAAATKTCVVCHADISTQKRVKDAHGRYYCHPCWNAKADGQLPARLSTSTDDAFGSPSLDDLTQIKAAVSVAKSHSGSHRPSATKQAAARRPESGADWKLLKRIFLVCGSIGALIFVIIVLIGSSDTKEPSLVRQSSSDISASDQKGSPPRAATEKQMQDDELHRNWIFKAAKDGDRALLDAELVRGRDVNATDENGETPLHLAANSGNVEIARLLLTHGAKIDALEKSLHVPPLWGAVAGAHLETVALLIENHAALNIADEHNGETVLFLAARNGSVDVAKLLIAHGAEVDARNSLQETPLFTAAAHFGPFTESPEAKRCVEMLTLLIEKGADVNARNFQGNTALHIAVKSQFGSVVIPLLAAGGADLKARNKDGDTAAEICAPQYRDLLNGKGSTVTAAASNEYAKPIQETKDGWTDAGGGYWYKLKFQQDADNSRSVRWTAEVNNRSGHDSAGVLTVTAFAYNAEGRRIKVDSDSTNSFATGETKTFSGTWITGIGFAALDMPPLKASDIGSAAVVVRQ